MQAAATRRRRRGTAAHFVSQQQATTEQQTGKMSYCIASRQKRMRSRSLLPAPEVDTQRRITENMTSRVEMSSEATQTSSQIIAHLSSPLGEPTPETNRHRFKTTISRNNNYLQALIFLFIGSLLLTQASAPANAQQYRPDWPDKLIEQEIFLLNLEDGYFGCQVNESQDFLQLFELSRLCDGQPQCYRGTDEIVKQLKCNQRDQCGMFSAGGHQQNTALQAPSSKEPIHCVNGVCLDGLCYCNDGWGGKSCDVPDENECKYRPCDVFAHCTNTMGSYYCSCFPGYDGDGMHCQDINECEIPSLAALCSDNSECCNLPGHFVCKCKPGYQQLSPSSSSSSQSALTGAPSGNTSVSCIDIDECQDEKACGKGALCENLPGSFRCACPPGFTGDPTVECVDMDECRTNPCGLGAQCTNVPAGYKCSCPGGFERNPLLPAAMFNQLIPSSQQAEMAALMAAIGAASTNANSTLLQACLDVNECKGQAAICGTGAQCINTPGGYFCQCPPGHSGNPKLACQDIDECSSSSSSSNAGSCGPNSLCKNTPGSYKCECKQGYTGNAYSADGCQDEDECLRKDACGQNGQCFNTAGSYQCTCQSGYTGDPYTKCHDIDECSAGANTNGAGPCGPGAQCINLAGGYKCACPDKFLARGSPEMGCERAAVDIGCSGDFDCTANAQCRNSTCQCKLGYQASGTECLDVDECSLSAPLAPPAKPFTKINLHQQHANRTTASQVNVLCGPEALCYNTDGSYRCDCKPGYEKLEPASISSKCRDIDECAAATPCGQNSNCLNTDGAYRCQCKEGFIPIDGDPQRGCKSPCDGVNCGQHAACKPHGEEAACVCKAGFTFDPNNIKLGCVDINECDPNYGPAGLCGQRALCTNVPGSYRCHCPSGYTGDAYRYCEDVNECDRKFGVFGQCGELAVCNNTAGSFTCSCAPGYSGDPKVRCQDIDECSTTSGGRCGQSAQCTNTPGGYSCRCPSGYTGDPHEECLPERPACQTGADCPANQLCQSGRCHCPFASSPADQDQECRHPCDKSDCGPNASCQLDGDNQPLCVCESGYMAMQSGNDGARSTGCVDINECIQGITLSGITPVPTVAASGNRNGAVALGPASAANGNITGGHPCGKNALCRNQPGSFDCVCPAGYSGNAYEACQPEVRVQPMPPQTTPMPALAMMSQTTLPPATQSPAVGGGGGPFGNYQQEPRTTACSEPCQWNQVCTDGQCVKPDACRGNQDCRPSMACEHVNQLIGFQCVNVCGELAGKCGPDAKCSALNHRAVCTCPAGYQGNAYDLVRGCQPLVPTTTATSSQTTTTSSMLMSSHSSSSSSSGYSSKDHLDTRTTLSNLQQQQADLTTTTAFGSPDRGGAPYLQQLPDQTNYTTTTTTTLTNAQQQTKRPSQDQSSFFGYELPLPTTPLLPPQFGGQTTTISQQQQQELYTTQSPPQLYQTTTLSGLGGQKATTTKDQPTTKRRPPTTSQQQQQNSMISHNQQQQQMNSANRQDTLDQSGKHQFEHDYSSQLDNKSAIVSQSSYYKQSTCSSDQHCPGNLYCLSSEQALAAGQLIKSNHQFQQQQQQPKLCGCPSGYRREADYCYLQRVNCSSSSVCKAREECISASILQQYHGATSQQFDGGQHFDNTDYGAAAGICVCPRGYKLTASGIACIDRNECDEGTPCAVGAVCQNKIGSYECVCPPGTVGEPYTKTCEPIVSRQPSGQLQQQDGHCQTNADCPNDRECDSLDTHRCKSPCYVCGPRATCTAANHAAICLCPRGYTGNAIDLVYGCQEAPQTTTAAAITTTSPITTPAPATATTPTSSRQPATTSAVGVPFTTLLPALPAQTTTTLAPIESPTTPELVEFRTIPPSELFVMCLADGIQVEVQLGGFDGIIYVKGHSQDPKCRKLVSSQSANEFVDFKVQFGHCDLIHRDGEAGFVLVIQKHPKLVTYRARAYHVKCVYNTGERTVTLGFNVSMITTSGTIANTGPPPTCLMSITSLEGREVTSAEIGQDLLLRVDVQPDSIYGGFARSCEAKTMDDEGEYQYEVTDANGCATDPSIFSDWKYDQHRKSLVARFNAFKFPSSNNLRFQCNIRVCFGSCPAVNCNGVDAYGKRRRRREAPALPGSNSSTPLESSNSDDPDDETIVSDTFKEGALREEIMVQSNAILTFDKRESSPLPQLLSPSGGAAIGQVEDIEFVCLPQLGTLVSVGLVLLLALLALGLASSCWCLSRQQQQQRRRKLMNSSSASSISCSSSASSSQAAGPTAGDATGRGPLPHPANFPNPILDHGGGMYRTPKRHQASSMFGASYA